ncbi:MAG: ferrochelatase [bacterium]|nr:ferrochelatase [bacterium]
MSDAHTIRRILLINMGGPQSLSEVKPYLRRLFSDSYVISGGALKRWILSRVIARAAAPGSRARYALIGGKSSAVEDAETLARQLSADLATRGVTAECAVGMRYSTPSIAEGLTKLASDGGTAITPVYLFPHETSAMTGSCAAALEQAAARLGVQATTGVRHLGASDVYARGWSAAVTSAVNVPDETFVLYSCHSLPLKIVEGGGSYVAEAEQSVQNIQSRLEELKVLKGLAGGLAYQSQEGDDWLGPTIEEKTAEAHAAGYRELIVVPLSFVGENTETQVDLDRDLRDAALAMGFRRVERLATPDRLGFLSAMVGEGLCKEWGIEW